MTLEEKIDYIGGLNQFYIRAIPRLGVPELKMADGPLGVRNYGPSTAYPAGINTAASWDTDLANRIGGTMGKDARARGVHFLLGPGMNIHRAPMSGRNFEYFGEDPFLAAQTAVAEIKGIQSQGVIATAKHFMGNDEEWDRHRISSDMDERTMREIYLPAFEAAVREAHVGAIMDSYNFVNGVHMTQNGYLNDQIAKQEWGFRGIIMSDWNATYNGVAAALGGLDLEMPSGKLMNRLTLLPAVREGKVLESVIDDKVRRILRTAMEFGFFDRQQTDSSVPLANPESAATALQAALGGMVLLKNEGVLPLDMAKLKSVAVIGPTANPAVTGGGGSSRVRPLAAVSFLDGIRNYAGSGLTITYASGIPIASETFATTRFTTGPDGGQLGLAGEYFNNQDLQGPPALVRRDERINFRWGYGSYVDGGPDDHFSARWTGYYTPDASGEYTFYVSANDGFRLYVDDKPLLDRWRVSSETLTTAILSLEGGKHYRIRLEYFEAMGQASIGLGIRLEAGRALREAKETAAKADAVILCVGFDQSTESEGSDRTFALPAGQDDLVRAILAANKKVVVVLIAGGNVDMNGWIDSTPALLHSWYPGQEGGRALAQILFGEVSPSGKLPISMERRWEDNATYDSYYDPAIGVKQSGDARDMSGAIHGHIVYKEGIYLGYRHFDKTGIKPLFPFGHGLSYTTFRYNNLKISPASNAEEPVVVSFDLTNTGKREGAEVAEVYVSDLHSKVDRPVKELKGFAKVNLKPSETRRVTVALNHRAFSYYDVNGKQWKVDPGNFGILVGGSSARAELSGTVALTR
jgi:beta-glucosidase